MDDVNIINREIDRILYRMANDPEMSLIEFHLKYNCIEKARFQFNESLLNIYQIITNNKFKSNGF